MSGIGTTIRKGTDKQVMVPASTHKSLDVNIRMKAYPRDVAIIQNLEFTLTKGEFVSLVGPSGCGKTTLLRLIAGLDAAYEGEIKTDGELVRSPGPDRGVVFQESRLLPWLSVEQNVAFALPPTISQVERTQRVTHVLELVGLKRSARAWPYQLSGGMAKRVALARALVNLPKVLLLDEPLSGVDPFVRFGLEDEIARLHFCEGLTTLLVTHDVDEAVYLSDRVLVLGGSPSRILEEFQIELARSRSRTSTGAIAYRQRIIDRLLAAGVGGTIWTDCHVSQEPISDEHYPPKKDF